MVADSIYVAILRGGTRSSSRICAKSKPMISAT
jgi:hypothetical protein